MKNLKYLFLFMLATFMSVTSVKAEVPTGEQYSEFATHKVVLLQFYTSSTYFSLYGYDFPGYSPTLDSFYDGRTGLVRYADNTNDTYSNWALEILNQNLSPGTYLMSWRVEFSNNSDAEQFCNKTSKPRQIRYGVINSNTCSVSNSTSFVALNVTLNASVSHPYIDFDPVASGLSANWFLRLATNVYYPQFTPSNYFDTGSLEDQNDIIINQNQQILDSQNKTNEELGNINNSIGNLNSSINDSSSDDATSSAGDFFSGFETDTFGLTSIITAPLDLIGSITSSSCSPLGLPLPYVDKTIYLPCLISIYQEYFGSFLTLYQTITFGIVAYWVCVRIFNLVKDFKNPDHDEIEVLDL